MENDNLRDQETLDDDIMQCRADILRSRNKAKQTPAQEPAPADNPVKRAGVTATRVNPFAAKKGDEGISKAADSTPAEDTTDKSIRIPQFEELIASDNQVVDALWETPEEIEPNPESQITWDEEESIETALQEIPPQEEPAEIGFEIDPDNIVSAEEEQALFDEPETEESKIQEPQSQAEATEEGLDALRKVVAEAKKQAQPEIDELEDINDMMSEDIEQIPAEKNSCEPAENIEDTTETMEITDLLEPAQDQDDIAVEDVQEEPDEQITSGPQEEAQATEEPAVEPAANTAIPKFDLAEQILKEQRQVASKRRQRPAPARSLNVMPIAGTVGQIIERAKKAVAAAAKKNESEQITPPDQSPDQTPDEIAETEPVVFDTIEVVKLEEDLNEPVLSVAACRVINESDRLNPFQEDIIIDIVSRDIARFCGDLVLCPL